MKPEDFKMLSIVNFTPQEVKDTGAALSDVDPKLMVALQNFRRLINRPVNLCFNGLTSGRHRAKEHKNGNAVDFYLCGVNGQVNVTNAVFCMIRAGFNGIGVYWNGIVYSFHGDLRKTCVIWQGVKGLNDTEWIYTTLKIGKL